MDADDRVRVSDAERETVVGHLNQATGEGRLTLEEFGERAEQAYTVRTKGELAKLVEDLPVGLAIAVPAPGTRPVTTQSVPVGAIRKRGRWRLDRDTHLSTVVGAVKVDLRRAEIAAPEVELHVETVLGSVKVWVPRGVRVEVTGDTVVGSRQVDEDTPDYPNAPLLRLRLDTVMGSVKVYRVGPR